MQVRLDGRFLLSVCGMTREGDIEMDGSPIKNGDCFGGWVDFIWKVGVWFSGTDSLSPLVGDFVVFV